MLAVSGQRVSGQRLSGLYGPSRGCGALGCGPSGALGRPVASRGLGRSSADCAWRFPDRMFLDFNEDPNQPERIAYASQVYQQAFGISPPERVLAAVRSVGFCSKDSVAEQVKSMPPTAAEMAAIGASGQTTIPGALTAPPPSSVPKWVLPVGIGVVALAGLAGVVLIAKRKREKKP